MPAETGPPPLASVMTMIAIPNPRMTTAKSRVTAAVDLVGAGTAAILGLPRVPGAAHGPHADVGAVAGGPRRTSPGLAATITRHGRFASTVWSVLP